jgi:hypothetical protein
MARLGPASPSPAVPPTCPKQRLTVVANGHQRSVAVARDLLHRRSVAGLTMLPKLAVGVRFPLARSTKRASRRHR